MKVLPAVSATAEQLPILQHDPRGVLIVRGAAGSGKTTTALLRLRFVVEFWQQQFARSGQTLNVLVLTFNRTLAGYVEALADAQVKGYPHVNMRVTTFGGWAREKLGSPTLLDSANREAKIKSLGVGLGLPPRFLVDEVDYATGRFLPENLDDYLTIARDGRGLSPAMPRRRRERLLNEVILPFNDWKRSNLADWGDVAVALAKSKTGDQYDVVVVDETQDFQANQVRAIVNQLAPNHSVTFVLDSAQRIYPHFFRWNEVSVTGAFKVLTRNHRNTRQIAAFAQPIIEGLDIGPDGAMPDFSASTSNGPLPSVLIGKFSAQMAWVVDYIRNNVDLHSESVGFLHPAGGGWFKEVRSQLIGAVLDFEQLTRERDWPTGPTNIGLSTMHSAKGLEFDHVIILGLNAEVTPHGSEDGDTDLEDLRRLLAMAVGRAKRSVVIGYKPEDASALVKFFRKGTFTSVTL